MLKDYKGKLNGAFIKYNWQSKIFVVPGKQFRIKYIVNNDLSLFTMYFIIYINIIQTQSHLSVSIWHYNMEFSLLVLYLILSRGNNFHIFKIKPKIALNKACPKDGDSSKKTFVGSYSVLICPGKTFLYNILRQCFFWYLFLLINFVY